MLFNFIAISMLSKDFNFAPFEKIYFHYNTFNRFFF